MINVALIGLGNISLGFDDTVEKNTILSHAKALYKDNRFFVKYCVDINTKYEKKIKTFFPQIIFYTNSQKLLNKTDIDIAVIATPTPTHFTILEQIQQNNNIKFFLIEKPLFTNSSSFDTLNDKVKNKIIINYIRLFEPNIQALKKKIENKQFQNIQKIQLTYTKGIKNNGSHFVSLINYLFNNPIIDNIQILHTQNALENDPTLDIVAILDYENKKIPIYMIGLDHTKYSVFDIDIYFDNSKVRIEDTTQNMLILESIEDEIYTSYKTLKKKQNIKLNFDIIMKFPYDYIYDLVNDKTNYINFLAHEQSNNAFYKNLKKATEQ